MARIFLRFAVILSLALLVGCATEPGVFTTGHIGDNTAGSKKEPAAIPAPPQTASVASNAPRTASVAQTSVGEFDLVTVLWGSNRALSTKPQPATLRDFLGYSRDPKLTLGYAKVSVPTSARKAGTIPVPQEVMLLSFDVYREGEDPRVHFTIGDVGLLDQRSFVQYMRAQSAQGKDFQGHAFVFVHGYANSFDDGLFRTAQLAYDMGFDGTPFLFSFPSKGAAEDYLYDRDSADAASPHLYEFLTLIANSSAHKKIHVIAHSMGAKLLVDTLFPIGGERYTQLKNMGQLVLAAPDIDQDVFKTRIRSIEASKASMTIYAHGSDEALLVSRRFAGNRPRVGEIQADGPFIAASIDTIDISAMNSWAFFGRNHSKYAESGLVIRDISLLLKNGTRPPKERFQVYDKVASASGSYWRVMKKID